MTIKDIARLSGYGVGTVSRVLNNHPDVSETARARIMAVIEQEGFEPNTNAKHLKMQTKSSPAILVKGSQNVLFADLLEQTQSILRDSGEDAYVAYLDEDADEVQYAVQLCRIRRPKGLIFLGGDMEHFRCEFSQLTVPCVLLTNSASVFDFPNLSSFTTDDTAASKEVIHYLHNYGHQSIGILGGNLSAEQISFKRLEGVRQAMIDCRLPFDQEQQYQPCRFSMQAGYEAAMQLLSRNPNLTAIFALSDVIALGAMRAIRDLGLRIPEDISIVGYDDITASRFSIPRLTTVHQNTTALASQGSKALLEHLHYATEPVHEIIPFELCQRESVLNRLHV
ncbi:Glucose-resistance amylase regulator [uncultured Flavonifractor sp.]|nr:Glucose-resistance amylase regulator [uncultured Flavonifractor sp.]